MAKVEKVSIALTPDMVAELRRLVQEGIDSGSGIDADAVFSRLRRRFGRNAAE